MRDIDLVEVAADGTPTTTSLIVADGTESQHKNVLEMIRHNLSDFEEFGGVAFETRPFDTAGGTQNRSVAVLNREHSMLLMTYMRNTPIIRDFKKRLIHGFVALEKRVQEAPALTEEEVVHQALQITYRKVQELEAKAAEDAPKVAYHDDFVCTEDLLRFATVASTLGITEKRLRELLAEHGWIFKEEATRRSQKTGEKKTVYRYSEYADKKRYFQRQEVHDAPRFRGEVMHTLKITPDGATAIVRAVKRWTAVGETPEIEGIPVEDVVPSDIPPA